MNHLDFAAINQALDADRVVPDWLRDGYKRGNEWVARNPNRADRTPGSFTINLRTGVWKDFAGGPSDAGSDLVSLYAYLFHGNDQGAAAKELAENFGVRIGDPTTRQQAAENVRNIEEAKPTPVFPVPADAPAPDFQHHDYGKPTATWTYRDRQGRVLLHVCRFEPPGERKQIIPRSWCTHPGKNPRWTWRGITGNKKRPLYRLDVLGADPERDAVVVEGEKAADAAQRLFGDAAICTTWLGGTATAEHANVNALAGRRVTLWPDFDMQREKLTQAEADAGVDPESKPYLPLHKQPGVVAMMHLAEALKGVAASVEMVGYTVGAEFPGGWDLADAEAEGWTTERVMQYLGTHAADPRTIATGGMPGTIQQQLEDAPKTEQPPKLKAPDAANEPRAHVGLTESVNRYGFPDQGDKGSLLDTSENFAYMLGEYGITVRYNVISKGVEVTIPGLEFSQDNRFRAQVATIGSLCARNRLPRGTVGEYITLLADANPYNPAAEWIDSKPWDGRDHISALVDTLDAEDRDLAHTLVRRWMIGAAGCVYEPAGMSMQGVLVLQGEQYSGKTEWFWSLTRKNKHLAREGVTLNPHDRDSVMGAISYWLCELGELDATFRKADVAALKQFFTKDKDELFQRYAHAASTFPRRTAFFASVNPKHFLYDETGNRRYWTIRHGKNMRGVHDVDMQQAWSQAKRLWASGEQHRLTREELDRLNATNAEHQEPNTVEELILARFDWTSEQRSNLLSATEVLLHIGFDRPTNPQAKSAGVVLRKLTGEEPHKSHGRMVFKMPPTLGDLARMRRNGTGQTDEDRPF